MQESKITAVRTANDRLATRRRAKRGLVAGYIHEISGRHAATPRPVPATGRRPVKARHLSTCQSSSMRLSRSPTSA